MCCAFGKKQTTTILLRRSKPFRALGVVPSAGVPQGFIECFRIQLKALGWKSTGDRDSESTEDRYSDSGLCTPRLGVSLCGTGAYYHASSTYNVGLHCDELEVTDARQVFTCTKRQSMQYACWQQQSIFIKDCMHRYQTIVNHAQSYCRYCDLSRLVC